MSAPFTNPLPATGPSSSDPGYGTHGTDDSVSVTNIKRFVEAQGTEGRSSVRLDTS